MGEEVLGVVAVFFALLFILGGSGKSKDGKSKSNGFVILGLVLLVVCAIGFVLPFYQETMSLVNTASH